MRIVYLSEIPEVISEASELLYNEFKRFVSGRNIKDIEKSLKERTNTNRLPLALTMMKNNEFIGIVSLKIFDLAGYENYSPWLASLYVKPEHRNKGCGKKLIYRLIDEAVKLNYKELYLYTDLYEKIYQNCGWKKIKSETHKTIPITIMRREL